MAGKSIYPPTHQESERGILCRAASPPHELGAGKALASAVNGQATYQSEVTQIPIKIPEMSVPEISKDQYKLYADISQPVYDGGMAKLQQQSQQANGDVEKQKIEIE